MLVQYFAPDLASPAAWIIQAGLAEEVSSSSDAGLRDDTASYKCLKKHSILHTYYQMLRYSIPPVADPALQRQGLIIAGGRCLAPYTCMLIFLRCSLSGSIMH